MGNHKRKKPKSSRAGCLSCKPHKHQRGKNGKPAQTKQENLARLDEEEQKEEGSTMKKMCEFSVPVVYTITGWVSVKARNLKEAKKEVKKLNDRGVNFGDIKDADGYAECMVDEIEEIG